MAHPKMYSDEITTLQMIRDKGFETAIIAGGYLRDTYHEKRVTDIDIYLEWRDARADAPRAVHEHDDWITYWQRVFNEDVEVWSAYSKYGTDEARQEGILAVWDVFSHKGMFNIIMLNTDPIQFVEETFDFGICKAYTDGNKVHYSKEFIADSRNNTITLVAKNISTEQLAYSMKTHLPRIQAKYPGYRFVGPGI